MFLLGQWKNFDDLEDSVTLNELVEIFNSLTERENRRMEFQAQIAGAELKGSNSNTKKQADTEESLADRLRRRKQEERESSGKQGKKAEFSHGVGYQVIGG